MISEKTLETLLLVTSFWNKLWLSPIKWDPNTRLFVNPRQIIKILCIVYPVWKLVTWFLVLVQIFVTSFFILIIFLGDNSPEIISLIVFLTSVVVIVLCVELTFLLKTREFICYINALLIFDRKLGSIFCLEEGKADGIEWIVRIAFTCPILLVAFEVPALHYFIQNNNYGFLAPLKYVIRVIPFGEFLILLAFTCVTSVDYYYGIMLVTQATINGNTITRWLSYKNDWLDKKGIFLTKEERTLLRNLYKAHQIFHLITNQLVFYLIPPVICGSCVTMITSIFCVFRLRNVINSSFLFLLIFIGTLVMVFLNICMVLAAKTTYLTYQFKCLFAKNAEVGKGDFRFLRASPTLQWKIGGIYLLTPRSFAMILHNIVIVGVINLLLTF